MLLEFNNMEPIYDELDVVEMRVHFRAYNKDRSINLEGYIPFEIEDFFAKESLSELGQYMRDHLSDAILNQ